MSRRLSPRTQKRVRAGLAAAAVLASAAALAEGSAAPSRPGAASAILDTGTSGARGEVVDESALRYYASQKQAGRVKAEIARLKRLYPGWTEPADLDSIQPSPPEEAPLWDLFSLGRFEDLRTAIEARRRQDPSWQPSVELATKLKRALFRKQMQEASASGRPTEVVDTYRANPEGLDPTDVESVWAVADAMAALGDAEGALALYKTVLDTSRDASQRRATYQKALGKLPIAEADRLLALAKTEPDGSSELAPIRTAITRARIVAFLHDEPAAQPGEQELAAYREEVRRSPTLDQQSLLAWYFYKRRQFREALDWFKLAVAGGGNAMVAHGLAHTLRELGQDREAEEVAYAWQEGFVGNSLLYVDILERSLTMRTPPFIEPARLSRYAQVVLATNSGEGAQALGWYAYNSCQFDAALEWFRRATAWLPKEATVFGLALTYQRLRRPRDMLDLANRYDGLFPSVVGLVFPESREPQPDPCTPAGTAQPDAGRGAPAETARQPSRQPPARGRAGAAAQAPGPVLPARTEFPVAIAPGNPLRYPSPNLPRPPERAVVPALREAPERQSPLIARRVPGVGAMPYERYGFSLLPDEKGRDAPSGMAVPAQGTIWRKEQTESGGRLTGSGGGEPGMRQAKEGTDGNGSAGGAVTDARLAAGRFDLPAPNHFLLSSVRPVTRTDR